MQRLLLTQFDFFYLNEYPSAHFFRESAGWLIVSPRLGKRLRWQRRNWRL
jgi:hypothetical protein